MSVSKQGFWSRTWTRHSNSLGSGLLQGDLRSTGCQIQIQEVQRGGLDVTGLTTHLEHACTKHLQQRELAAKVLGASMRWP